MNNKVCRQAYAIADNIKKYSAIYGTSDIQIAQAMGVSRSTFYRKREKPWTFTIEEVINVAGLWNKSTEQMLTCSYE